MDIQKGDVFIINQNYKELSIGNKVRILKVNEDTVDLVILDKPELWLKDIPISVLDNDYL